MRSSIQAPHALEVFVAAFNHRPQAAAVARDVSGMRLLEPAAVARLYGPHGLLSDARAPGGAGPGRSLSAGGELLASNGGNAIDLSQFTPEAPAPLPRENLLERYRQQQSRPAPLIPRSTDAIERYLAASTPAASVDRGTWASASKP